METHENMMEETNDQAKGRRLLELGEHSGLFPAFPFLLVCILCPLRVSPQAFCPITPFLLAICSGLKYPVGGDPQSRHQPKEEHAELTTEVAAEQAENA